jgi:hypothetical protein
MSDKTEAEKLPVKSGYQLSSEKKTEKRKPPHKGEGFPIVGGTIFSCWAGMLSVYASVGSYLSLQLVNCKT